MLKIYQVDAFTREVFRGNPAAVVPLEGWPEDVLLQSIAAENNLAETAFIVPTSFGWELRWFTPKAEVALCGHATLATAHVLVNHLGCADEILHFVTRQSGTLMVDVLADGAFAMSFPAISTEPMEDRLHQFGLALGQLPNQLLVGRYSESEFDYVAVFDSEDEVAAIAPDFTKLKELDSRGVIVTSKGDTCDFVSRYFAPRVGIDEDPVTGSAHCLLAPYWSALLKTDRMNARQISERGGEVQCFIDNGRVVLTGYAADYLIGEISF